MRQSCNILLIDGNMKQLVNTLVPFGTPLEKAPVSEPVEMAFASGKPQITGLFIGSVTKKHVFAIIVPVRIDGENRYALARLANEHALAPVVAAQALPSGWHPVVSDAAHRIIAWSEQDAFIGKELPPGQRHGAGSGLFDFNDSEGRPALGASTRSELTGWQSSVWAPAALLEAPVRALRWTIGLTALAAFALVVALASWLGRIVARSVGHAVRAAIALGKGGPMPLIGTPVAEVDTLMAELHKAAAKRRAAEDWRHQSEAIFRAIFDVKKRYIHKDGHVVWARTTVNVIPDGSGRPWRQTSVIQNITARKHAEQELQASKDRLQLAFDATQLGWWQYDPIRRVGSGDSRFKEIFDLAA